ncbi:hypothetical protein HMPREF0569_1181 [Micrococcus luteus SK58]|uniref:hypothetical protein n=1 Tax=Micrococcus luteus TaxID=1270 RepID=UPI0001C5015E|nr:hypothetical protein [Micrococcus luteus]EFD51951.1 hypothetical protein HMPREF0569_1181 [Micrococcus luteus SK58]
MTTRTNYTDAQIRAFIAAARGGRDNRAELLKTMRRHPAGSRLTTGAANMTGHRTIPRDLPHNNEETAR